MVSAKSVIVAVAASAGLLQMCPAPPAVVAAVWGGVAGGVVAGGLGAGATLCAKYCPGGKKRSFAYYNRLTARDLPPGVSQQSIDQCTQQINDQKGQGTLIEIQDVDENTVNVNNMPPACMDLATVLSGNPAQAGGPVPVPMGSSSMQYRGISVQDRQNLATALGSK